MKTKNREKKSKLNIAIIGASGYTGSEVTKLLLKHPMVKIGLLVGEKNSGKKIDEIFKQFIGVKLPTIKSFNEKNLNSVDVIFSCMPSGSLSLIIDRFPKNKVIIDLSADFRFKDRKLYKSYYNLDYNDNFSKKFVYGLTEINRTAIKKNKLISCPGCYPTSVLLPIIPLIKSKLIKKTGIIIDSKSGISGAGRNIKEELLFTENYNSVKAYGNNNHRHTPEMEHNLFLTTKIKTLLSFTPHLIPINRGIMSTIYVKGDAKKIHNELIKNYNKEKFVKVSPFSEVPKISDVTGSNLCRIGVMSNRRNEYVTIISVIDNLLKGASGQAVQNMNAIFNFPEELGLDQLSICP